MTKKPKEKYSYVFPNLMARAMAKVDMRTQMEASMLSQFLLIIGLSIMFLFTLFSQQTSGFYKFMVIFNLLAGWLLISSYLVTTYQQYTSYMGAMGYDPDAEKATVKKKGSLLKRIITAIRRKKKKKLNPTVLVPGLLNDAVENMEFIDKDRKEIFKKNV